jgi:hypothetical protein
VSRPSSTGESKVLSRDLSAFLVEFSIALHKNAVYPPGHPLLKVAVSGVIRRVADLLEKRGTLNVGVARDQLVIEGVATDPTNPLLRELAQRLHRQHIGAIKLSKGARDEEVGDVLKVLAADSSRTTPLGLGPPEALRNWEHVRLFPLAYEQLELMDDKPADALALPLPGEAKGEAHKVQLWVGLASAALQSVDREAEDADADKPAPEPEEVARAIDDKAGREKTYDQVIVGYLLQIADELKMKGGAEAASLQRRVSKLVGTLKPETLRRLLDMGGDITQRKKFVLDASQGMAVNAVLELVQAAAATSHQNISHSLIRVLSKLAANAETGPAPLRADAEAALRENVQQMIEGWELEDPNPITYTELLDTLAKADSTAVSGVDPKECEPIRMIQMAVEIETLGEPIWRALDLLIFRGEATAVIDVIEQALEPNPASEAIWNHLVSPEVLKRLLLREPVNFDTVDRLAKRLGMAAVNPMLDALAASDVRATRRKFHDRLTQYGFAIGPQVVARLPGAPWYIVRNMLALLGAMPTWPKGFSPLPYARNEDPRVRREALRLMFRLPETRDAAIVSGLGDPDEAVVRQVLGAALERCPTLAVAPIMRIVNDRDRPPAIRALAIRAVASARTPAVLDALIQRARAKRSFFGRRRLAPKSPEMLGALSGLAIHWSGDGKAADVLKLAVASGDPEIRAAANPRVAPPPADEEAVE